MTIEQKLKKFYIENLEEYEVSSVDELKEALDENWGKGGSRGYGIFWDDHFMPREYSGDGFTCVNRIDEMNIYYCDSEAAKQAEKDGVAKIIRDIRIPKEMEIYPINGTVIDTEDNRKLLTKMINEYRELKKKRYAVYIYRKSDGECVFESEPTVDEMFIKKNDAKKFAKESLDTICRAFNVDENDYEIEIERNHYLDY